MSDFWNTPVSDTQVDNDFPVLDPGTYEFEVVKVTPKEYIPKPTSKIGRCGQIDLQLRVNENVYVFESLFTDPSTSWKIGQFAKSIGIYYQGITPGEVIKKCVGMIGEAELNVEEYNGRRRNRVRRYIEKKEEPVVSPDDLPF